MKITYETINLLMLLIPGLISGSIYALLLRRSKDSISALERMIESLIFTFLIYVLVSLTYKWEPLAQTIKTAGEITYKLSSNNNLILLTLAYMILIPAFWGAIVHYDFHMRLFRLLKLTDRTSRDTAWDDVFIDEKKRYLTIHLKDERRISGWPTYYSNNKEEGFVYLTKAAWITEKNKYIETGSHGLLIDKENIDLIEFMYRKIEVKDE